MAENLSGKKFALLIAKGVEQVELEEPMEALKNAEAECEIISLESGEVKAWDKDGWGDKFQVDKTIDQAQAADYDGLVIPGGVMSPDYLRQNERAVEFVSEFFQEHKPVASICHGPWMLAEADAIRGRRLTSYPSLKTDLINAGGDWVDQEVVTDQGLVTSRHPGDLKAFCDKMIEEFSEGKHQEQELHRGGPASGYRGTDEPRPSL